MPQKQASIVEDLVEALAKVVSSTVSTHLVPLSVADAKAMLLKMLDELGVDTAGVKTESETATITIED